MFEGGKVKKKHSILKTNNCNSFLYDHYLTGNKIYLNLRNIEFPGIYTNIMHKVTRYWSIYHLLYFLKINLYLSHPFFYQQVNV